MPIPQCKRGLYSDALYNQILNLTRASINELPPELQQHDRMIALHILGRLQDDIFVAQIAQQHILERARIQATAEHGGARAQIAAIARPITQDEIVHTMQFLRLYPEHFTRVALRNFRQTFNIIHDTILENIVYTDHINVIPAVVRALETFFNLQLDTAQPTIDPTLQTQDIAALRENLNDVRAFTQVMLDRRLVDFDNDRELEDIFYEAVLDETPGPSTTPIEGGSTPRAQQRANMIDEHNPEETPQTTMLTFTRGTPNPDEDEYREILEMLGFYNTPAGFTLTIPLQEYAPRARTTRPETAEETEEFFFFEDEENGIYGIDNIPFDLPVTDGSTFDEEDNEEINGLPAPRGLNFDEDDQEESERSDETPPTESALVFAETPVEDNATAQVIKDENITTTTLPGSDLTIYHIKCLFQFPDYTF